jgi:phosphoserine aminotransferase
MERADAEKLKELGLPPVPIVFDYLTTLQNNSLYNTLPIFSLYIADLVFQHLLSNGGIEAQQARSEKKASLVYSILDKAESEGKLRILVSKGARSRMNIPFKFTDEKKDGEFVKEAESKGMMQLKGHRSLGGIRVSLYNAITVEQTERFAQFFQEYLDKI